MYSPEEKRTEDEDPLYSPEEKRTEDRREMTEASVEAGVQLYNDSFLVTLNIF